MIPLLVGAALGVALVTSLYRLGALQERSGIAVLLGAIALFWPVFAFQANAGALTITLHSAVFLAFAALAAYGFRNSATVIALGIMAHGLFDAVAFFAGHPGPIWWPAMCGALDITVGAFLIYLIRSNRIPA